MKRIKYIILGLFLFSGVVGFGQGGYFSTTYNVAIPMGNTKSFIDRTSFRGYSLEAGGWINDNVSLGFNFSWNGFYEETDYQTYEVDNLTLWAKRWRYINAYPLMGTVKYYLNSESDFEPYAGVGLGVQITHQETDFGMYSIVDKKWLFSMYPEIGFNYWFSQSTALNFNMRYNWAAKGGNIESQSYLGFNIGFVFYSW